MILGISVYLFIFIFINYFIDDSVFIIVFIYFITQNIGTIRMQL